MKALNDDKILKTIANMVCPFIFLYGVYVILNGHLSPGGGFSGGTIIGASLILYQIAFGFKDLRKYVNFKTMVYINVGALLSIALFNNYSFVVGSMGLPSIIRLGTPGMILSAGVVFLLDIAVGIKVACTMYELYALFSEGEV